MTGDCVLSFVVMESVECFISITCIFYQTPPILIYQFISIYFYISLLCVLWRELWLYKYLIMMVAERRDGEAISDINNSLFSCDVSNRLSRESSQDILVEDLDRLSTTSAMSESSVSHRLNDVQDVQDIARMQEESLKHSTPVKNGRSDTISPLSEQSLSSPVEVEEGGGYQSEESCGSESGLVRPGGPRRGEVQPRLGGYSSQDSLPDSPYSSQSLDSHASHGGPGISSGTDRHCLNSLSL